MIRKRAKQDVVWVLEYGAHRSGSACQAGMGGNLIEIPAMRDERRCDPEPEVEGGEAEYAEKKH
jgi:hypothetical protein